VKVHAVSLGRGATIHLVLMKKNCPEWMRAVLFDES
jgi:hypothetical protein